MRPRALLSTQHYPSHVPRAQFCGPERHRRQQAVAHSVCPPDLEALFDAGTSRYGLRRFPRPATRAARAARTRKPILFDAFLSVYDTLCFDRKRFAPSSPAGRLAFWLDRTSCSLGDLVLLDTEAHARYFCDTFGVPPAKVRRLFVGCDETVFFPRTIQSPQPLVLFYGTFLPLHGIDIIIRAAKLVGAASSAGSG